MPQPSCQDSDVASSPSPSPSYLLATRRLRYPRQLQHHLLLSVILFTYSRRQALRKARPYCHHPKKQVPRRIRHTALRTNMCSTSPRLLRAQYRHGIITLYSGDAGNDRPALLKHCQYTESRASEKPAWRRTSSSSLAVAPGMATVVSKMAVCGHLECVKTSPAHDYVVKGGRVRTNKQWRSLRTDESSKIEA